MPIGEANGVSLFYETSGLGKVPIILIHGSWTDHSTWNQIVPKLRDSFRVLIYDRRGHSKSETGPGQGSANQDALDADGLLTNLGLVLAHVVGSSFGGTIALKLAAIRPSLFRTLIVHEPPLYDLILNDPTARSSLVEGRESLERAIRLVEQGDRSGGARLITESLTLGPGSWDRLPVQVRDKMVANADTWLDETRDPDARTVNLEALRRFDKPTLLMYGGKGLPGSTRIIEKLGDTIPKSEVAFDPSAGHTPQISNPVGFAETIIQFALSNKRSDLASRIGKLGPRYSSHKP